MALDFIGGAAGGAAEGLEQVLRRVFLEAQQRQQAALAREQQQVQMRGQDITARGQDIMSAGQEAAQRRFDTTRIDQQTKEMAEGAEAAAGRARQRETMARFVGANPNMGRVMDARSLGLNISDPHAVETPDEHAPHQAADDKRKIDQITAETTAREQTQARFRAPAQETKFWVIRNGQPVRVSEREYQPGDLPANTREQGRPVISGDANRIADLKTSLDDLKVLRDTLKSSPSATGTIAKLGAMAPNVVTEVTGFGADAKSRQAVINRVKQVIGKALEGGVLRKEDEIKYEKILPTIADPDPVVETKLNGLEQAIGQRLSTFTDALGDAGYDVSKFGARQDAQADAAKRAADLIKKYGGG